MKGITSGDLFFTQGWSAVTQASLGRAPFTAALLHSIGDLHSWRQLADPCHSPGIKLHHAIRLVINIFLYRLSKMVPIFKWVLPNPFIVQNSLIVHFLDFSCPIPRTGQYCNLLNVYQVPYSNLKKNHSGVNTVWLYISVVLCAFENIWCFL